MPNATSNSYISLVLNQLFSIKKALNMNNLKELCFQMYSDLFLKQILSLSNLTHLGKINLKSS